MISTAVDKTQIEWLQDCANGQYLARQEDGIKWRLADLCLKVQTCGKYGTGRMEAYAKELNVSKSTVYDRAKVAGFYDDDEIRAIIDETPFVTYSHCRLIRRYTDDIKIAVEWIIAVGFNAYTYDELNARLMETFKDKPLPPPIIAEGVYGRTQLRDLANSLPTGKKFRVRITEIIGGSDEQ